MAVWDQGHKALEKGCSSKVWGRMGGWGLTSKLGRGGTRLWLVEKYLYGWGGI